MGIKHLNKFLRTECSESIKAITIAELSGKKIAVDISIYMYKYESNEALIENMYLMLATFCQYNIIPIFIFDGKPPTEKKALLQKRKEDKKEAVPVSAAQKETKPLPDEDDDWGAVPAFLRRPIWRCTSNLTRRNDVGCVLWHKAKSVAACWRRFEFRSALAPPGLAASRSGAVPEWLQHMDTGGQFVGGAHLARPRLHPCHDRIGQPFASAGAIHRSTAAPGGRHRGPGAQPRLARAGGQGALG